MQASALINYICPNIVDPLPSFNKKLSYHRASASATLIEKIIISLRKGLEYIQIIYSLIYIARK